MRSRKDNATLEGIIAPRLVIRSSLGIAIAQAHAPRACRPSGPRQQPVVRTTNAPAPIQPVGGRKQGPRVRRLKNLRKKGDYEGYKAALRNAQRAKLIPSSRATWAPQGARVAI